jgi:glutathione peroxidase
MQNTILDTEVTTIDGEVTSLQPYSGNVLLIVNVASKCGLTPHEQLENLQKTWHQQGFSVLGSPAISFWAGAGQRRGD